MTRSLFFDVTRGATAASILGALVDLGVAPSPILHALGDLDLPAHLVIEDAGPGVGHVVRSHPGEAPVPVKGLPERIGTATSSMPQTAALLAQHALEKLVVATRPINEGPCQFQHSLDAGIVLSVCGAAMAVRSLEPDAAYVSRVAADAEPPEAIVELLGDVADALDFGAAEGTVTEDAAALLAALVRHGGWGVPEPAWKSPVARGASGGTRVALGET